MYTSVMSNTTEKAGTLLPETRVDAESLIEASAYLEMAAECFDIQQTKLDPLPLPDRDTWWNRLHEAERDIRELYDRCCSYACRLALINHKASKL